METIEYSSKYFIPRMSYNRNRWSISKQSYFTRSKPKYFYFGKVFKPKEQLIEFPSFSLLGGNRKDPLNLNELIQKKKQSTTNNIHGNDRSIEILLQPNIFDPLCLDISSYSDQTNQHIAIQKPQSNLQQVSESNYSKTMNEY
jgi:hypothetical protein